MWYCDRKKVPKPNKGQFVLIAQCTNHSRTVRADRTSTRAQEAAIFGAVSFHFVSQRQFTEHAQFFAMSWPANEACVRERKNGK